MGQIDLFDAPVRLAAACASSAVVSPCGRYRYRLSRQWCDGGPALGFLMLNPSTADASVDDPTIRRCMGFARRDGYGGIVVANLFAWRATDPRELRDVADPVGPDCDDFIRAMPHDTVIAWGATRPRPDTASRIVHVAELIRGKRTYHLGLTRDGACRHPLYVRADQPLVRR